jgi:hypothetical protein
MTGCRHSTADRKLLHTLIIRLWATGREFGGQKYAQPGGLPCPPNVGILWVWAERLGRNEENERQEDDRL